MPLDDETLKTIVKIVTGVGVSGAVAARWWVRSGLRDEKILLARIGDLEKSNQALNDRLLECEKHRAVLGTKLEFVIEDLAQMKEEIRGLRGDLS